MRFIIWHPSARHCLGIRLDNEHDVSEVQLREDRGGRVGASDANGRREVTDNHGSAPFGHANEMFSVSSCNDLLTSKGL